jgi:hypothetical protein
MEDDRGTDKVERRGFSWPGMSGAFSWFQRHDTSISIEECAVISVDRGFLLFLGVFYDDFWPAFTILVNILLMEAIVSRLTGSANQAHCVFTIFPNFSSI